MQCITDKFDSLNIIECAIAQTYLSGTDCPGHWLALEGVGRGLDLNWTLVFQSKFTLLSYCLFSRFKASHWLRVRGKVLQWLFPRTTVQFYLFHVAAKTTAKLEFKCNFSSLPQIEVCRNRVALRDHTSWHGNPPFFSPSWTNSEMKIYLNDRQWAGESRYW